jgi:cytochrome c biogenesis protein CcmG/thiol:disulfide interchange protein DsbE
MTDSRSEGRAGSRLDAKDSADGVTTSYYRKVERGVRGSWIQRVRTIVAGVCLLGLGAMGCDRGSHPINIGKPAPEFVITDGTQTIDLAKLRGKVVVLNLWATWCAPCVEELPSLLAMQRMNPEIAVVAVSTDQDDEVYRKFLVRHQVDVATVRDAGQRVNALYGTVQIPETYIIDRQGILRRKFIGAQDWTGKEIEEYLHKLAS